MKIESDRRELLTKEKIPRLLGKLALPAIAGMTVNALYNLVDTIFIGQGVGALAIGGLSIALSAQVAMFSFSLLFGVGAASIISRSLGAGDREGAAKTAGTAVVLGFLTVLLLLAVSQIFLIPLIRLLGGTEEIIPYTERYLRIILFGFPVITLTVIGHNTSRAEGRPKIAMFSLIIGAGMNIILDAVFIFVFNMGIRGAATATVIARCFSLLFLIRYFKSGKSSIKLSIRSFIPDLRLGWRIAALGSATFVRQIGMSVLILTVNNVLKVYGSPLHISAYGIFSRLLLFGLMPMFGINQAFQPIAGYNWGAGLPDRSRKSFYISLGASVMYALILFAGVMIFPGPVMSIFTGNRQLIELGTNPLRYLFLMMPFIPLQILGATFFLAVGKAVPAFILTLSRQVLFLIPMVIILPNFFGLMGIWYAFPLADGLSVVLTVLVLTVKLRKPEFRQ
ncbi:MAG: MATE family efflux transporter [Spirochaetia bacterium]